MSLLRHEIINTALPKAKELRRVVEPMITLGKKNLRWRIAAWRSTVCVTATWSSSCSPNWARVIRNTSGWLPAYPETMAFAMATMPMALVELVDRPDTDATPVDAE